MAPISGCDPFPYTCFHTYPRVTAAADSARNVAARHTCIPATYFSWFPLHSISFLNVHTFSQLCIKNFISSHRTDTSSSSSAKPSLFEPSLEDSAKSVYSRQKDCPAFAAFDFATKITFIESKAACLASNPQPPGPCI
jgi:hypothetical protein